MPHPIVEIDELVRLVIDDLVETDPRTAVSFALTCRSLEEPTLSSLWTEQRCFTTLLRVLSGCTLVQDWGDVIVFERDPSAKDWARLHRYASWMRKLYLGQDEILTTDTFFRLSSNLPGGVLFPKLERLTWTIHYAESASLFFRLFLSPRLQRVVLSASSNLSALAQVIPLLPTSLEHLVVLCRQEKDEHIKDAVSSFVCRCGPSLRSLRTRVALSEAATDRLMQLPNLSHWTTTQEPPQVVPTSIFPSLESVCLDELEALPWLHLLASHESDILRNSTASAILHSNIRETLKSLDCSGATADPTLLFPIMKFRNLVTLNMEAYRSCEGGCIFHLTDDDMENLTAALPSLKSLWLGSPCRSSSCITTITSLLSISVHCLDLTVLETHFNTRTIVSDMQRLLDGGAGRDNAKCKLESLIIRRLPLEVGEEDIETVATGFKVIFPYLTDFNGYDVGWHQLGSKLGD